MSQAFAPTITQAVGRLGISNFSENLQARFEQAEQVVRDAGTPEGCNLQETGISPSSASPTKNSKVLVFDIGGTNTKVSYRSVDSEGNVTLKLLLEEPNSRFNDQSNGHSFRRYVSSLVSKTEEVFPEIRDLDLDGVALVWSYGMKATSPAAALKGNSALVDDREKYGKPNFFIENLVDGDDIGAMFLDGLKGKISTKTLLIANDTVFTLNATSGAHAGVVCSSGGNGTLLRRQADGTFKIFNSESGGRYIVPPDCLSTAEREFFANKGEHAYLERLAAGAFMGDLFERNVVALAGNLKSPAFVRIQDMLVERIANKNRTFSPAAVSLLANGRFDEFQDLQRESLSPTVRDHEFETAVLVALESIARAMHNRAGEAAAVLAYMSIVAQFTDNNETFRIAFDSTIGTSSPVFLDAMKKALEKRVKPHEVVIELLEQVDGVSVPSLGAFRSIDEVLQNG